MPEPQKKTAQIEDILTPEGLQNLPVGRCVGVQIGKEQLMVCRPDENEYLLDGKGIKFHGKIK